MKIVNYLAAAALALVFSASAGAQEIKVGIVDMTRVFAEYYKTKDAEKTVNEDKAVAKKDLDERNARYKTLIENYQNLAKARQDPLISDELRAQKTAELEKVAAEARSLEREKKEFAERRQRQLLEKVERERKAILDEIKDIVEEMAKEANYDLVFDKSGLGTRGIPFLLHSKDAVDFSDQVIDKLNAGAPAE